MGKKQKPPKNKDLGNNNKTDAGLEKFFEASPVSNPAYNCDFHQWLFTKCPAGAKKGSMLIGAMWLPTPPIAINVTELNPNEPLPLIRTGGNPKFRTLDQNLNIQVSAIFNGVHEINGFVYNRSWPRTKQKYGNPITEPFWSQRRQGGLRDLVAMFMRTPLLPIMNEHVISMVNPVPNKEAMKLDMTTTSSNAFAEIAQNASKPYSTMSRRLPVAFQSLTISTIPTTVDALRVDMTFAPMDVSPLTPEMEYVFSMLGAYIQNSAFQPTQSIGSVDYIDYLSIGRSPFPSNSEPFLRWYRGMLDEYYSNTSSDVDDWAPPLEDGWHLKVPESMFAQTKEPLTSFDRALEGNGMTDKVIYSTKRLSQVRDLGRPITIRIAIPAITQQSVMSSLSGQLDAFGKALDQVIGGVDTKKPNRSAKGVDFNWGMGMVGQVADIAGSLLSVGMDEASASTNALLIKMGRIAINDGTRGTQINIGSLAGGPNAYVEINAFRDWMSKNSIESNKAGTYDDLGPFKASKDGDKLAKLAQFWKDNRLLDIMKSIYNSAMSLKTQIEGEQSPAAVKTEQYFLTFSRSPLKPIGSYENIYMSSAKEETSVVQSCESFGQGIITSLAATISNKLAPIKLEGRLYPFYQYLGRGDWIVSMTIQTTSVSVIRALRLMSLHALRTERVRVRNANLAKSYTFSGKNVIIYPFHLEIEGDFFTGILGTKEFLLDSATYLTVEGKPGLFEIQLNLVADDIRIDRYEQLIPKNMYPMSFFSAISKTLEAYGTDPIVKEKPSGEDISVRNIGAISDRNPDVDPNVKLSNFARRYNKINDISFYPGWFWAKHLAKTLSSVVASTRGKESGKNETLYLKTILGFDNKFLGANFGPFTVAKGSEAGKFLDRIISFFNKGGKGTNSDMVKKQAEMPNAVDPHSNIASIEAPKDFTDFMDKFLFDLSGAHFRAYILMLLSYGGPLPMQIKRIKKEHDILIAKQIGRYRGKGVGESCYPDMELPEYSDEIMLNPAFYFYRYPTFNNKSLAATTMRSAIQMVSRSYNNVIAANKYVQGEVQVGNIEQGIRNVYETSKQVLNAQITSAITASATPYGVGPGDLTKVPFRKDAKSQAAGHIKESLLPLHNYTITPEPLKNPSVFKDNIVSKGFEFLNNKSETGGDNKEAWNLLPDKAEACPEFVKGMGLDKFASMQTNPDMLFSFARSFGLLTDFALKNTQSIYERCSVNFEATANKNPSVSMNICFPAYSISFAEQDSPGNTFNLHDWYSYYAVASIDTHRDIDSSTGSAIVTLENILGIITDPTWILNTTESVILNDANTAGERVLDSLYIQPGMGMQIRLGFDSDAKRLPLVFVGRVTEVEQRDMMLVVQGQSLGAGLHEKVGVSEPIRFGSKLGLTSFINSFGTIATALLDKLSGLDDLGQTPKIFTILSIGFLLGNNAWIGKYANIVGYLGGGLGNNLLDVAQGKKSAAGASLDMTSKMCGATWYLGTQAGLSVLENANVYTASKNIGKVMDFMTASVPPRAARANMMNRAFFGLVPNMLFNPRDDNIMLEFNNVLSPASGLGVAFDWVIYNKSVWEALQQIAHHHDDHICAILPFDEDNALYSRETIYIGPRHGWYRYTNNPNCYITNRSMFDVYSSPFGSGKVVIGAPRDLVTGGLISSDLWLSAGTTTVQPSSSKGAEYTRSTASYTRPYQSLLFAGGFTTWEEVFNNGQYIGPPGNPSEIVDPSGHVRPPLLANSSSLMKSGFFSALGRKSWSNIWNDLTSWGGLSNLVKDTKSDNSKNERIEARNNLDNNMVRAGITRLLPHPQYRPIRNFHLVTSFNHIIANKIKASKREMWNRVELVYSDDPTDYAIEPDKFNRNYTATADDSIYSRDIQSKIIYDGNIDPGWLDGLCDVMNLKDEMANSASESKDAGSKEKDINIPGEKPKEDHKRGPDPEKIPDVDKESGINQKPIIPGKKRKPLKKYVPIKDEEKEDFDLGDDETFIPVTPEEIPEF